MGIQIKNLNETYNNQIRRCNHSELIADRKSDIHNIGGDSKQAERLSKLNKKIARQIKKQYKT